MNQRVWIHADETYGEIIKEMTYGAYVRYSVAGIEFFEMMDEEDFVVLEEDDE